MKKIIFSNNKVKYMEFDKKFIDTFKSLAIKTIKQTNSLINIFDEDIQQEIDILIYRAYVNYNSDSCFTTYLYSYACNYARNKYNTSKTLKRDSSIFTFISMDSIKKSKDKGYMSYSNVISSGYDLENDFLQKDIFNFIFKNLNKFESDLLVIILTGDKFNILCKKYKIPSYTITRKKKMLIKKIRKLFKKYNEMR